MLNDEQKRRQKEIREKRGRGEPLTAEDEAFLGFNSTPTLPEPLDKAAAIPPDVRRRQQALKKQKRSR
jgi:hypothetical protein